MPEVPQHIEWVLGENIASVCSWSNLQDIELHIRHVLATSGPLNFVCTVDDGLVYVRYTDGKMFVQVQA